MPQNFPFDPPPPPQLRPHWSTWILVVAILCLLVLALFVSTR